jgi:hypothetical protein
MTQQGFPYFFAQSIVKSVPLEQYFESGTNTTVAAPSRIFHSVRCSGDSLGVSIRWGYTVNKPGGCTKESLAVYELCDRVSLLGYLDARTVIPAFDCLLCRATLRDCAYFLGSSRCRSSHTHHSSWWHRRGRYLWFDRL